MLFIFMAYFAALLIFLVSGSWLFSETTIISERTIGVDFSTGGGGLTLVWHCYSSDALLQSLPSNGSVGVLYSPNEFHQLILPRFSNVVGIPETMIADNSYFGGIRTFFSNIDQNLLPNLSSWEWGGATYFPLLGADFTVPSAQGYFNQTEQRFYVSDGRQYQVVPEPTSFSLLLAGLLLLINSRRLKNAIT